MKIILNLLINLLIWLILPLPATVWWFNAMKMNYRSARSWADKIAVCIIAVIFLLMSVFDLIMFVGICSGVDIFGIL